MICVIQSGIAIAVAKMCVYANSFSLEVAAGPARQ